MWVPGLPRRLAQARHCARPSRAPDSPASHYIYTRQAFGDCQLHIEFAEPSPAVGEDQDGGNSGVFLMGLYEIQVLDSFSRKTYPDGQAAAVYGQYPPLVNASRPPGRWQSYDILFHGPPFVTARHLTICVLRLAEWRRDTVPRD